MTTGWAIKHKQGWLSNKVSLTRRDAIYAEVRIHWPRKVPDWEQRSVSWRWRWLKRHYGLSVVRVQVVEVPA